MVKDDKQPVSLDNILSFFFYSNHRRRRYKLKMKHIINIQEGYGVELHTRQLIERLAASLNPADSYLLDMQGVQQISRSAAD